MIRALDHAKFRDRSVTATGETRRDGYVLRHWHQGGLALHAVSDLDAAELAVFVRAWQGQP